MSTTQIRERFHTLIDHIDDDRLKNLYNAVADVDTAPSEITDELTNKQKRELEVALSQINDGNVLSHQEAKRQIDEWLSK